MPTFHAPPRARFFTICAANYLAGAIVLGRSIASAHPGSRLTVFLLDELPAGCTGLDHLDVVPAASTMPVAEWHHFRCFYEVIELATGIKPRCFAHVLKDDCDVAVYLDADIEVFRPFDAVLTAIREGHAIVLTPHLLTPLPADGELPDDLAIMRAGIYNLGFAAFANAPQARAFLDWWGRRLRTQALVDVGAGLFTDQKWMDYAPALCGTTFVLRDPGCNVAYWNLHERTVRRRDGGWRVDFADGSQADLAFYHFSGFSPSARALSKHETRFGAKPPGDTAELLDHYGRKLLAAGHAAHAKRTVAEPRFDNGIAWDPVCRRLYRDIVKANPDYGDPLQGDDFFRYARRPAAGDHLPRYLRAAMGMRADVAAAYDDGRNLRGLMLWLASDGGAQLGIDPALVAQLQHEDVAGPGVNVVGYFRSHLGIGEAARGMVAALGAAGVPVATHDVSRLAPSPTGRYGDVAATAAARGGDRHGITLLVVNADQTPRVLAALPDDLLAARIIGHWAWETPDFPEAWCDRFALVDEVWVASSFVADAVRAKATVPVVVIPYAVQVPQVAPDKAWLARACPGVQPGEFTFACFFDVASVPFRKNPQGAIDAFAKAFAPDEPVRLVVKVLNGARDPALLAALARQSQGLRITFLDAPLESIDRFRLLASVDAFVSLHRAEGFGLVIAEAMALGRPVVVTRWSGNADFTSAGNSAIVSHRLVTSAQAHGPYPAGTPWAEPDLDDAARQMRRVVADGAWRSAIGAAAAETIATRFSAASVGALIAARLARLAATPSRRGARRTAMALPRAAPALHVGAGTALRTVSRDALRRPFFYASRAHRVPAMIARDGFGNVLGRLAHKARERDDSLRRRSSLRTIVLRFWSMLRRPRRKA